MGAWKTRHLPEKLRGWNYSGMKAFYVNTSLRTLAFSLVGIFTPIYIYKIMAEVSGSWHKGLIGLVMYYLVVRGTVLVVAVPFSRLIERVGFRKSVALSTVFLVLYFVGLFLADDHWMFVYVAGVLLGLNIPLYWISRFSVLSMDGAKKGVGKEMGLLNSLDRVGGMLGPAVGAAIIKSWGFSHVYLVAFVVLVISVVPLMMMPRHRHRNGVSWRGFWRWLVDRRFYHQAIGTVARVFDDYSSTIVWPLVIWMLGINLETIGWVFSLVSLLALFYRLASGVLFDWLHEKGGREDEIFFGVMAIVYGLTWVGRAFVSSIKGILILDGLLGGSGVIYRNISDDYVVLGGRRMSEIAYYTYRTLTYTLGVFAYLALWLIGIWWGSWRLVLFGATAVMMVVGIVQARESDLE